MAKRRRVLKGTYNSPASANRRRYRKVASGSPVTKAVPRACAIVQSGPKKGKLRKGCRIDRAGRAHCDLLSRLPATARGPKRKGGKKRITVSCK